MRSRFVNDDEGDGATSLGNWDRATTIFKKDSCTSDWHHHDPRRTGAAMLGNMGIEPHIAEASLNHAGIHSKLAVTYNVARYCLQVADALQRLADRLDIIGHGGANMHGIGIPRDSLCNVT